MEQDYSSKMSHLGYNHLICDIFPNWEDVKDEILLPERKEGEGNGTIHVFLGAADKELQKEFSSYYNAVNNGQDPSTGAIKVKHYFLVSNIISMIGYLCKYYYDNHEDFSRSVQHILSFLDSKNVENGMISTFSLFKLSTGSSRLRPYFKQFEKRGVFTELIRQILIPKSSYKISLYKNDDGEYAAFWLIGFDWQTNFEADSSADHFHKKIELEQSKPLPLQVIFYGAPGTGKSHTINEETAKKSVIRTTFHPDSDYSTFVGAYKPTTEEQTRYNDSGVPVIYHDGDHKGEAIKDKVIVYDFVEQAFLKAYEEAWKKFCANPDAPEDEFLVIEEINRGNCAQIFGDLFQLLDRNIYGYSEYPISADNDISKHLKSVFEKAKMELANHNVINDMYKEGDGDVAQKVIDGEILLLPKNLYIWATMNTSDQSLFPIDSAFKRRWDWKYQPITKGMDKDGKDLNWCLTIDDNHKYDWWSVISNINSKIVGKLTKSEDKKLGYFFCKANNKGIIEKDIFVEKVLFYLWNEILKDYEPSQDFLKDDDLKGENDGFLSYDLFYDTTSGKAKILGDRVNHLLANLKVEPWKGDAAESNNSEQNEVHTEDQQENITE